MYTIMGTNAQIVKLYAFTKSSKLSHIAIIELCILIYIIYLYRYIYINTGI